jgi:hypothetical protein
MINHKQYTNGLINRWLTDANNPTKSTDFRTEMEMANSLPDKKIKQILEIFLISQGWHPEINWKPNHGIDIEAKRENQRWIIEVKSTSLLVQEPVNSFVSVLGKILQRMDDQNNKYSVAMPDTEPFNRLWKRLPLLAKQRTGITALFVNPSGLVREESV